MGNNCIRDGDACLRIFDNGDMWIETHIIPRAAIPNGTTQIVIVLDKPGRFVGASVCIDSSETAAIVDNCDTIIVADALTELTYGESITQMRVLLQNSAGGAVTFGAKLLLFMKK